MLPSHREAFPRRSPAFNSSDVSVEADAPSIGFLHPLTSSRRGSSDNVSSFRHSILSDA